ncbi:unnamed protein product, partial [Pleuronectes platessa]
LSMFMLDLGCGVLRQTTANLPASERGAEPQGLDAAYQATIQVHSPTTPCDRWSEGRGGGETRRRFSPCCQFQSAGLRVRVCGVSAGVCSAPLLRAFERGRAAAAAAVAKSCLRAAPRRSGRRSGSAFCLRSTVNTEEPSHRRPLAQPPTASHSLPVNHDVCNGGAREAARTAGSRLLLPGRGVSIQAVRRHRCTAARLWILWLLWNLWLLWIRLHCEKKTRPHEPPGLSWSQPSSVWTLCHRLLQFEL